MGVILIAIRSLVFVLFTLLCTVVALVGSIFGGHQWALGTQRFWSVAMLRVFGVKTVLHGNKPDVGLMMSNHQSYIDIWLIPKYAITVFVAKAEVKKMPLVGWGASAVNTVYVDRSSKESRQKTKNEISERIRKGRSVIIFPEGTTGDGNGLLPLKPGMFFNASEEGFPIIPVAIFYENPALAWVGDDNMGAHFFRNFSRWSTKAHIAFGEPMIGADGEELMERYQLWMLKTLEGLRKEHRS
ncbi:MAG: 1-acyl-sn-glycerol-3-phosphate acyltransferase [Flavobacteriales bacterium]|nr:1-acyl-sn-glycerol-3-phosphate acyltransferase [Flavobacteriales bacterium]